MKSILLSIRPQWVKKIASGKKTIEVRKTVPKEIPFKAYIYCTKDKIQSRGGKVIGEFMCDRFYILHPYVYDGGNADLGQRKFIETFTGTLEHNAILAATCLSQENIFDYIGCGNYGYGWHISDLKIYDKPKELSEFISPSKAKKCVDYCINGICSNLGYEELCGAIRRCKYKKLTHPSQSYMFVKEVEE